MPRPDGPLLTDLYQLTMLQAYFDAGMDDTAVFEFFVRRLPPGRGFLLAAGLEQVLDYLEGLRFDPADIAAIDRIGGFHARFLDWLGAFRFSGDVHAMPEGTPFFAEEPILRVTAPLPQAQFVETRIVNLLHLQTLIASKAVRCVLAAPGRLLVDFGLRRAHGAEAGLFAARAARLAGFAGTATVEAHARFGIPVFGTMAHSFVQAWGDETQAFAAFARSHPDNVTLLIDTFDTEAAAAKVVSLAPALAREGIAVKAVRIDSGDLAEHARRVRALFDAAGLHGIGIFASSSLDEYALEELVRAGAPIDGFGIGTRLDTSSDAPYLDCVYKLQEYAGEPKRKRSEGKATWPGRKQVWRGAGRDGRAAGDLIGVEDEPNEGRPLIAPVMRSGRRLAPSPPLDVLRARTANALGTLPPELLGLRADPATYPVAIAPALHALAARADRLAG